jgi:flagellar assembly factor FliW
MPDVAEQVIHTEKDAPGTMLHVSSGRFGTFDVPAERVLHFTHGLIGFPTMRRFVILEHRPGSPFKWMLSLDDPELAFAVADPCELVTGYHPPLDVAARLLAIEPGDVGLFAIVTIPSEPSAMTVNLMAPVVVDLRTREARQLVLDGARGDCQYPVLAQAQASGAES